MTDISYLNDHTPEERFHFDQARRSLHALIEKLPDKEKRIIQLYYFEDLSFDEMRSHFDRATRSWLCRLHRRALDRLKRLIFTKNVNLALI
jgi:RNA polymerase sigma factor for flagellar operon FliA